jgi:hypothetical protein
MHQLDELLTRATEAIPEGFFLLPIVTRDGSRKEIYREKVYCYELYHQLRTGWDEIETPYVLNGEVDKQGHPYFGDDDGLQPDLLIHVPRSHDNFAVVEIKPCNGRRTGIDKDLDTFQRFRGFGYQRCIYLVYGLRAESTARRIIRLNNQREVPVRIDLWIHPHPGRPAFHFATDG